MNHANPQPLSVDQLVQELDWLCALATRLVGPEGEDLAHDTVASVLENPPAEVRGVRAFLATVVRRKAANWHRSRARRRERETSYSTARGERGARAVPDPAALAAEVEMQRVLVEAVLSLESIYRDVLLLRYFRDRSPSQIAEQLEISVETVTTRLRRAREALREKLDREQGGRAAWLASIAPLVVDVRKSPSIFATAASVAIFVGVVVGLTVAFWTTERDDGATVDRPERANATVEGSAGGGAAPIDAEAVDEIPDTEAASTEGVASSSTTEGATDDTTSSVQAPTSEPGMLAVQVTDVDGVAQDEVSVQFAYIDVRTRRREESVALTDSEGWARFRVTTAIQYGRVHAQRGRFAPSEAIEVPELPLGTTARREIVVGTGSVARGRVVDTEGRPVSGLEIQLFQESSTRVEDRVSCDANGRFEFDRLHARCTLRTVPTDEWVSLNGVVGTLRKEQQIGDIELVVDRPTRLRGIVRTATGQPVERAMVAVGERGHYVSGVPLEKTTPEYREVRTGPDGRFELVGVPRSVTWVTVTCGGYPITRAQWEPAAEVEIEVELESGAVIAGRVIDDATGRPVEGADVQLCGFQQRATSDAAGRFQIERVPERGYDSFGVSARASGYAFAAIRDVQPGDDGLELRLEAAYTASGRVVDTSGEPVVGAEVSLLPWEYRTKELAPERAGYYFSDAWYLSSCKYGLPWTRCVTDATGGFLIEGLRDQRLLLRVHLRPGAIPSTSLEIETVDAEELTIEVDATREGGATIVGQVIDTVTRQPVPRFAIAHENFHASDGRFELTRQEPGTQSILVTAPGYENASLSTELVDGTNELDIELHPVDAVALTLRFRTADGKAARISLCEITGPLGYREIETNREFDTVQFGAPNARILVAARTPRGTRVTQEIDLRAAGAERSVDVLVDETGFQLFVLFSEGESFETQFMKVPTQESASDPELQKKLESARAWRQPIEFVFTQGARRIAAGLRQDGESLVEVIEAPNSTSRAPAQGGFLRIESLVNRDLTMSVTHDERTETVTFSRADLERRIELVKGQGRVAFLLIALPW